MIKPENSSQMPLHFCSWGGARKNAGRKPSGKKGHVQHAARPVHTARHPVHITTRLVRGLPNIRKKKLFKIVKAALARFGRKPSFRIVEYSVQSNHIHLIVEASDREALSRGMQGLKVSIARRLNRVLGRTGGLFAGRYHEQVLETPRQVRNALAYVLLNGRKHLQQLGKQLGRHWVDPCASGGSFDGWRRDDRAHVFVDSEPIVCRARTWLLKVGWKKRGLLSLAAGAR